LLVPQTIVVYSISLAAQTLPIGPSVGIVEIVMTSLYTIFGIPPAVGGTATTMIRAVTFWFQIIVGYAVVQWMGIKILFKPKDTR
ncbi:MAG: lysylphosphatidylglycerol synthase domain-containing protein, partial [Candidatus Bathyarchaeia archaeon]